MIARFFAAIQIEFVSKKLFQLENFLEYFLIGYSAVTLRSYTWYCLFIQRGVFGISVKATAFNESSSIFILQLKVKFIVYPGFVYGIIHQLTSIFAYSRDKIRSQVKIFERAFQDFCRLGRICMIYPV